MGEACYAVLLRTATHCVAITGWLLRVTHRLVTAFQQFRGRFPGVTQFPERGNSIARSATYIRVSLAVRRSGLRIEDLAAEHQVAGEASGGASRDEMGGPLGVHGEQCAHLEPARDDGVELVSAAA